MKNDVSWPIRRILSLLALAALLPALILVVAVSLERRHHETGEALDQGLALVRSLAAQQASATEGLRQMLGVIALLPEAQNQDRAALTPIFQAQLRENPAYANILMTDLSGLVTVTAVPSSLASEGPVSLADRRQFSQALSVGGFAAGGYILGRHATVPALPFALPVFGPDQTPRAVLMAAFRLDAYRRFLAQADLPPGAWVDFLDADGVRIFGYPETRDRAPGERIADRIWDRLNTEGKDEGWFLDETPSQGNMLRTYGRLRLAGAPEPYLTVLMSLAEAEAFKDADALALRFLLFLAGATLLALFSARWVGERAIGWPCGTLSRRG